MLILTEISILILPPPPHAAVGLESRLPFPFDLAIIILHIGVRFIIRLPHRVVDPAFQIAPVFIVHQGHSVASYTM